MAKLSLYRPSLKVVHPAWKMGVVVPTLGTREDWLRTCLAAISSACSTADQMAGPEVVIVCPSDAAATVKQIVETIGTKASECRIESYDEKGLSRAINFGVKCLSGKIEYCSWIGDDDILAPSSLSQQIEIASRESLDYVVGSNLVIDATGNVVRILKASPASFEFARYGRNFIPQPGSVIKRTVWSAVGGLDEDLHSAMDLDLFMKLRQSFRGGINAEVVAAYRWHESSLSATKNSWSENDQIQDRYTRSKFKKSVMSVSVISDATNKIAHKLTHKKFRRQTPSWLDTVHSAGGSEL